MQCPSCREENPKGAQFCMHCAARLTPVCARCGAELPAEAHFCPGCALPVEAGPGDRGAISANVETGSYTSVPTALGFGRYEVKRFLGEGAKKRVYLARDTRLDRDVAIGVIKTEGLDPDYRRRVEHEVRAMGRLGEHRHIVNVYDVADDGGLLYLVSQYIAGGDLEQRLQQSPDHRLPLEDTLRIVIQLCEALEHAHGKGIVHRDIKPANVYLAEDGAAKLGDFGLAVSLDRTRLTQEGMMVGTVAYMPPEQALGQPPDPRGDLYALGALLYEMVTGRTPFVGDDAVAIISQHINTAPVAPSWHNPEIPESLETLILALLAKDPEGRPENAAQVRAILREVEEAPKRTVEKIETPANPLDRLASGVFVGRDEELKRLRSGLDDALSGRPRILMLVGEPGIGKTRTAEELTTYARMRGAQVLWGHCYEGDGAPAFWPWIQIIRAYVHHCDPKMLQSEMGPAAADIATIVSEVREQLPGLPELPALNPNESRFRLFEGIVSFLRNASLRQPLGIVLDDLHWADKSSLSLLEYIAAEIGPARLLVLGTYRDVELRRGHPLAATLAELARSQQSERILLRGLTQEDVTRFIEQTCHIEPSSALVEAVYRETEGNAFFMHEVVRLLATDGRLERNEDVASWSVEVPQGVREVVGRRLNRTSEDCNQALRVAAVLGREFDARVLQRVADLPEETLLDVLDEAIGARLIEEPRAVGGQYRFAHSLVRQTLYEELSTPRRVRLHQRAGEALGEMHESHVGPHVSEIAFHFFQAAQAVGTELAVDSSIRAGDWARDRLAYEEAAVHYRHATEVLRFGEEPDELRLCELLVELGRLENLAGDGSAMVKTGLRAAELARRLGANDLFAHAILVVYGLGGLVAGTAMFDATAVAQLEEALEQLGPEDKRLRARLLNALALQLNFSNEHERRRQLRDEARAIATGLDDASLLFDVTAGHWEGAESSAISVDGRIDELLPFAEESVRLAQVIGTPELFFALGVRGSVRLLSGDAIGMREDFEAMERLVDELRSPGSRYIPTRLRAMRAIFEGRLDDGERLALEALAAAQRFSSSDNSTGGYGVQTFVILLHRGTLSSNLDLVAEFADTVERSSFDLVRSMLARMYAALDSREEAAAHFELLAADDFKNLPWGLARTNTLCMLAEVCVYLEDEKRAALLYEEMLPNAQFHGVVGNPRAWIYLGPFGMRLGMLATLLGRFPDAEEHFHSTVEWTERAGARPWLAYARIEYARMLLRRADTGDRERALVQINAALELAHEIGMQGVVQDAVSLKLAAQGVDSGVITKSIMVVATRVDEQRPDFGPYTSPDGTVTLMFSDMEDYTGMLERLGDLAAHDVVKAHNAIVRERTAAHRGHEVELRGDGFLLAFASARQAVLCAIDLQRAFAARNAEQAEHPIQIRIGLHTGEAIKDADKFFGKSVVQAFRVADLARGGEILISSLTRDLVQNAGDLTFDDEREVKLKGLAGTHRVHRVRWAYEVRP